MSSVNETQEQILEELNKYALDCKAARKYITSKVILERSLILKPDSGVLWNNLGAVLWNLNQWDEAEAAFKKSIDIGYQSENVHNNLGLLYASEQKWDDAAKCFAKGHEINPTNTMSRWEQALAQLDNGDWKRGLENYEVRFEAKPKEYGKLQYPMWNGEDLNGKTIFIQSEQGSGDRILFSRYFHWLKTTYPDVKIKYLGDWKMHNLFWELKEACDIEFIPDRVPWPKADYGLFLMSLPKFHGTTPYNVYSDPGLIRKRIEPIANACNLPEPQTPMLKVGICWTGNPDMDQNTQRSIPLELMMEFAENPKVLLYNLQVGPDGEKDVARLGTESLICNVSAELEKEGWVGTAQVIMNLDLVITCCTSIAHLAGALNKPCWVLLCYSPYWLWLRDRTDSVWYPSVRLFRQQKPGEWRNLINNVKEELSEVVKTKGV